MTKTIYCEGVAGWLAGNVGGRSGFCCDTNLNVFVERRVQNFDNEEIILTVDIYFFFDFRENGVGVIVLLEVCSFDWGYIVEILIDGGAIIGVRFN